MDNTAVAIVATNDLIRHGLQMLIQKADFKIQVVGSFASLIECEKLLKKSADLVQILLLDDSDTQDMKPLPTVNRLLHNYSHLKVVIISRLLNGFYVQKLIAQGVVGFLFADDQLEETINTCLHTINSGHIYLSPQASALPYHRPITNDFNTTDFAVLELMADGLTSQEIASRLDIVPRSVYRIRRKLREYLNVRHSEQIIEAARQQGLLS